MNFLKIRNQKKPISLLFIAFMITLLSLAIYKPSSLCKINAYVETDFCYKYTINVTNTDAVTKVNYPVLLANTTMDSFIGGEYIDKYGWSIYPYQSTYTNELDVLLQDINTNTSNQWYIAPNLPGGTSNLTRLSVLMGSNSIQRNQGIYFTGQKDLSISASGDYLTTPNAADFNQNAFKMEIDFEVTELSATPLPTGTILEKYDDALSQGYKLQLIHVGGTGIKIRATLDSTFLDSTSFIPSGNEEISFEHSGGIINLTVNGVSTGPHVASYTPNIEDLYIGVNYSASTYTQYLKDVILRVVNIDALGVPVAYYGFNPIDMAQTSYLNPSYAGNIQDISGSVTDHVLNYFFYRDQSDLIITASRIVPSATASSAIFGLLTPDIVGRWYGAGDPNIPGTPNANLIGLEFLSAPANLNLPDTFWYTFWLSAFGVFIGIGVFWVFNTTAMAILGASTPLVIGSMQGLVSTWYMVLWFILFIGVYSTYQWYERS